MPPPRDTGPALGESHQSVDWESRSASEDADRASISAQSNLTFETMLSRPTNRSLVSPDWTPRSSQADLSILSDASERLQSDIDLNTILSAPTNRSIISPEWTPSSSQAYLHISTGSSAHVATSARQHSSLAGDTTAYARQTEFDPLTLAAQPPENETAEERQVRLREESEAQRVSDLIDAQLAKERLVQKRKKEVKVLLLGQTGSGKTTMMKHFYFVHDWKGFQEKWRGVIYLNLVQSLRRVMGMVSAAFDDNSDDGALSVSSPGFKQRFNAICARLEPLIALEQSLVRKLNGEDFSSTTAASPEDAANHVTGEDDPAGVLAAAKSDMIRLWHDPDIRRIFLSRRLQLEQGTGFFLDEIDRIAEPDYIPNEKDVFEARWSTRGVTEYRIRMKNGSDSGVDWKIYEIGGARSQRRAWMPYFDSVNTIIFLAPISEFDQLLAEDRTVNRLEDTILFWRAICSNRLLADTSILLLLSKIDLLKAKLSSGVQFSQFATSYGERPNDFMSVTKYLRQHFLVAHRRYSPNSDRKVSVHVSGDIDYRFVSVIIMHVRESIVRSNLNATDLL
ncbi:G-protein alpha subunit-domain-containing protein [Auriculariales sp. MPI-PUGE-AT-0066]|nr:G-protein alpha subunit-domain-containing protein [Auriculariales sp. MPI-PUGE-AT-0066]